MESPSIGEGLRLPPTMKAVLFFFVIAFAAASADEVFRVSRVVAAAGEGVERMTFKAGDHEQVLFVEKEAVLRAADVLNAQADILPSMRGISVRLKPDGAKKLEAVTGKMKLGVERLAVFVEGKPVFAPVVHDKLGAQFIIQGFDDLTDDQLKQLAARIAGNPPEVPGVEMPGESSAEPKWKPYTEEEYQQIKARRAKLGIYYLDTLRSEEELDAMLVNGMSRAEVVAALGKPTSGNGNADDGKSELVYHVAPERWKEEGDERVLPTMLIVRFTSGKLSGHDVNFSLGTRELKKPGWMPPLLRLNAPEPDFSRKPPTEIEYFESVKAEDPDQAVNRTDLEELIGLVTSLELMQVPKAAPQPVVSVGCDLMQVLSRHFPEVKALCENAKNGNVVVAALGEALTPYRSGRKPLPLDSANPPVPGN